MERPQTNLEKASDILNNKDEHKAEPTQESVLGVIHIDNGKKKLELAEKFPELNEGEWIKSNLVSYAITAINPENKRESIAVAQIVPGGYGPLADFRIIGDSDQVLPDLIKFLREQKNLQFFSTIATKEDGLALDKYFTDPRIFPVFDPNSGEAINVFEIGDGGHLAGMAEEILNQLNVYADVDCSVYSESGEQVEILGDSQQITTPSPIEGKIFEPDKKYVFVWSDPVMPGEQVK